MVRKDKNNKIIPWECPRCGTLTDKYPAISRIDNKTEICPDCGTDQAMLDFFHDLKSKKKPKWKL